MNYDTWIPNFQSKFKNDFAELINYKRANGCKYGQPICNMLLKLDTYLATNNIEDINYNTVDSWLKECNENNKNSTKARYLSTICIFCDFLIMRGNKNVIYPEGYNIQYKNQFIPYIFSKDEINIMIDYIKNKLIQDNNISTKSFYILFCLYYCCGLRKSEALNLKITDYNEKEMTLIINNSKNNTTRIIPLSNALNKLIFDYINSIDRNIEYIFIQDNGKKYSSACLYNFFRKLLRETNIPIKHDGENQRIHDLRHTFAVHSLKQMEDKGMDLYTTLPLLTVYLGHKSIVETEYYLRLVKFENENIANKTKSYIHNLYGKKVMFYEQ